VLFRVWVVLVVSWTENWIPVTHLVKWSPEKLSGSSQVAYGHRRYHFCILCLHYFMNCMVWIMIKFVQHNFWEYKSCGLDRVKWRSNLCTQARNSCLPLTWAQVTQYASQNNGSSVGTCRAEFNPCTQLSLLIILNSNSIWEKSDNWGLSLCCFIVSICIRIWLKQRKDSSSKTRKYQHHAKTEWVQGHWS